MAKKDKESKKSKKAPAEEVEAAPEHKYGVQDIADKLGIKAASVRVQLRNKGIEKAGKSYGWDSKSELNEVIDQIKSGGDDDGDEKPAKKSSKKASKEAKSSKKASKKSKARDEDEEDDD